MLRVTHYCARNIISRVAARKIPLLLFARLIEGVQLRACTGDAQGVGRTYWNLTVHPPSLVLILEHIKRPWMSSSSLLNCGQNGLIR